MFLWRKLTKYNQKDFDMQVSQYNSVGTDQKLKCFLNGHKCKSLTRMSPLANFSMCSIHRFNKRPMGPKTKVEAIHCSIHIACTNIHACKHLKLSVSVPTLPYMYAQHHENSVYIETTSTVFE